MKADSFEKNGYLSKPDKKLKTCLNVKCVNDTEIPYTYTSVVLQVKVSDRTLSLKSEAIILVQSKYVHGSLMLSF